MSIGGLVAVGMGVAAILILALAAVFVLAFQIRSPTDAVVAIASGAFGVIGSVVGAYFGVKVGTDQSKPIAAAAATATEAATAANLRSQALALHVPTDLRAEALNAANEAVATLHFKPSVPPTPNQ
jgi:uncharacterized membrane protein YfcA